MKVMNNKKLTARRYLEQIQEFDIYINQDLERLEEMKVNACSTGAIDYSKDRVQTSPSGDTLCKQVTNYVAFNDKINAEIDSFADAKEQIIKEIRGLKKIFPMTLQAVLISCRISQIRLVNIGTA